MLCDRCHKRYAKVLYTEIINGVKNEQHLCEECAAEYTSFHMDNPLLNPDVTLNNLLSTLLGAYTPNKTQDSGESKQDLECSNCHTTYEEFLQRGRFGCAECYRSFHKELGKTLRGIQGAEVHAGKRPKGFATSTDRKLQGLSETERLTLELQEAIEKEEFEEAARLRDLIKQLKKEESGNA
jgi:UvrB/uvrC motif.